MPGTDPLCPPSLLILRQSTAAAEADFARAGDRGRTGDLVLGEHVQPGTVCIAGQRTSHVTLRDCGGLVSCS